MFMFLKWVVAFPLLLGVEMALVIFALSWFVDGLVQEWALVSAASSGTLAFVALAAGYMLRREA